MSYLFEDIKNALTAQEVLEKYGFEVNCSGFTQCPFHASDNTGSLKVYPGNRGWHCFGCNVGGSVIDFVMLLYDISFKDACNRLNSDFNLNFMPTKETHFERSERVKAAEKRKKELEAYRSRYIIMSYEYRRLWFAQKEKAPKSMDEPLNPEFVEALHKLPTLELWFEENPLPR